MRARGNEGLLAHAPGLDGRPGHRRGVAGWGAKGDEVTKNATLPNHLDVLATACSGFAHSANVADHLKVLLEAGLALCPAGGRGVVLLLGHYGSSGVEGRRTPEGAISIGSNVLHEVDLAAHAEALLPSAAALARSGSPVARVDCLGLEASSWAPLTERGEPVGLLLISGLHTSETERRAAEAALRVLATQASMALLAARSLAQLEQEKSERSVANKALNQAAHDLAIANRLSGLGELAASVVHEVNNPLTAILVSADAASRWLADPRRDVDRARQSIARISQEASRTRAIVEGLKRLAQSTDLDLQIVEIGALLREVIAAMQTEIHAAGINLSLYEAAGTTPLWADRIHLQRVFLNLIRNAVEAMAEIPVEERSLTIRIRREDDELLVGVSDRGRGAPTNNLEQMFGTLFTTKRQGMGVGLSLSRRIAAAHHGRLTASRNPEGGLTFTLALPVRDTARQKGPNPYEGFEAGLLPHDWQKSYSA